MRLLTFLLLATICSGQAKPVTKRQAVNAICPTGWSKWEKKCYILKQTTKPWLPAENDCNQHGGHLVSVDSSKEQEHLNLLLAGAKISETYVWIGFSDRNVEGTWRWSDNSSVVNYTNWYDTQQQPNGKRNENCAVIASTFNKWFDRPCGDQHIFICETKTTPVSQPFEDCSFEKDLCGYSTGEAGTDFSWSRKSGPTSSASTGPAQAADGAYYVYIETSSPRVHGDVARLTSPLYDPKYCDIAINFFYHMYGTHIETLNVKIVSNDPVSKTKTVFTKKGNRGNQWNNVAIGVPRDWGKFRLVFEGVRGSSHAGDIAIDKVVLRHTNCGIAPLNWCSPPPPIEDGTSIYKKSGQNVTYKCNPGLALRGYGSETRIFYCKGNGTWNIRKTKLVCEADCPADRQRTGQYGIVVSPGYPSGYHNNQKCSWTIVGLKGHKLLLDFTYFQTEFIHDNLEIYAHPRGELLERLSGRLTPRALLDVDSVRLVWTTDSAKTDKGFLLKWKVSTCAVPVIPSHGRVQYSGVDEGDTAQYECTSVGYELTGTFNMAICQKNGTWSIPSPRCVLKSCPPLVTPKNGQITVSTITYGSYATYKCNTFYLLNGNSRRYCQANATWTGHDPSCEVPDCGPLKTPSFGKKIGEDTVYDSIVHFVCHYGVQTVNGYSGSLRRTCQRDATWSGTPVTCINPVGCDFEYDFCGLKPTVNSGHFKWFIQQGGEGRHASFSQTGNSIKNGTGSLISREFHPTRSCYTLTFKHSLSGNGSLRVYKTERAAFVDSKHTLLLDILPVSTRVWINSSVKVTTQPYTYLSFVFEVTCRDACRVNVDDIRLEEVCKDKTTTTQSTAATSTTPSPTRVATRTVPFETVSVPTSCLPQTVDVKTGEGMIVQSPGFDGTTSYGTNLSCEWNARHVGDDGYLRLKFTKFDLPPREATGQCSDAVLVHSSSASNDGAGVQVKQLCGREGVDETSIVVAKPTWIRIVFNTSVENRGHSGFQAGILGIPQI